MRPGARTRLPLLFLQCVMSVRHEPAFGSSSVGPHTEFQLSIGTAKTFPLLRSTGFTQNPEK